MFCFALCTALLQHVVLAVIGHQPVHKLITACSKMGQHIKVCMVLCTTH